MCAILVYSQSSAQFFGCPFYTSCSNVMDVISQSDWLLKQGCVLLPVLQKEYQLHALLKFITFVLHVMPCFEALLSLTSWGQVYNCNDLICNPKSWKFCEQDGQVPFAEKCSKIHSETVLISFFLPFWKCFPSYFGAHPALCNFWVDIKT